ncbi:SET domain-containing protein [Hydrogenophaga sp. ANAO-22]|uniref:SET domain-containing protein n=1 Tax=Hydrogenophaga sp. ANAO-22 TaxID=3166645 RepID=UPI0036D34BF5
MHDDYQRFLAEYSLAKASVTAVVADMRDHIEMPPGYDSFALGRSRIHGRGLFCTLPVPEGKPVAMARVGACRTVAGRLTNHSPLPNCVFVPEPEGLVMLSRRTLTPGEELTVDYRQVGCVNGWGLRPVAGEVVTTLRWRALALRRLGEPWANWCEASHDELARDVDGLLRRFGYLPSIDMSPVEKQSKEIK